MTRPAIACSEFERLIGSVAQRIESSDQRISGAGRNALALAIVQDVAAFVLEWVEGAGRSAMHGGSVELEPGYTRPLIRE